ncbi:hypothetical protein [Mycobacterium sp. 1081908.1]|uniref:hypothetical protein n=1 Tax=Mycobacterium sp. 1081908.1 TaxID=1834066 RepID=UPI0007FB9C9E|nr:hypothetical protein [Mycobacterium sp. 1081908.1]OBK50152.1 hypothetical protein A5655_26060 [Mycobacterium sp. 1081908.1]
MLHLLPKLHTPSDAPAPDAETRHHWRGASVVAAIGHIHLGLPEPRTYPLHEPRFFEDELMSRLMEHL